MNINFTAPCNTLGYGYVGFNILKSLYDLGNEIAFWPIGPVEAHPGSHDMIKECINKQGSYDREAPSFRHYHQFDLAQHVGKGQHIGSTVFELDTLTNREVNHLMSQDKICVPTAWAKRVLEKNKVSGPPIHILHHGIDRNIFNEKVEQGKNPNNTTKFINIGKWEVRKGHDVLVEAFNKAFTPKDNVSLMMACHNPFFDEVKNNEWANLYLNSEMGKARKITVLGGRFKSQEDVAALMAYNDCGIFPSRAEGWGLESFEMMSMGKPVILTNYGGHTEYANNDNSMLIDIEELEPAYDGVWFNGNVGLWAAINDNQIDQIIEYMRKVHEHKQCGSLGANLKGIETAKLMSWEAAAKGLVDFVRS